MKTKLTSIICSFASLVRLTLAVVALLAAPAASRADTIYVSDTGHNTIKKFTSGGIGSVFANTGLNEPFGLAFDSAGNLYAANGGNNTIEKFTQGGVGSVLAKTGMLVPSGVAFDSADNLYAVNQGNNTVEKFTPGGVGSVFANSSGLFGPTYIAIQPGLVVPEPSTWAMLGLGIPGLLALRRKRERVSMRDRGHTSSNKPDAANPAIASLFQPCSPAVVAELRR